MNPIRGLRTWWQQRTGEEETPFDGGTPYWVVSMLVHLVGMVILGLIPMAVQTSDPEMVVIETPPEQPEEITEPPVIEEVYFSDTPQEEIGANSADGEQMAMSLAQVLSEFAEVPSPTDLDPVADSNVEINNAILQATGLHFDENLSVRGAAGEGASGAVGAVDRITHEILLSLEERETMVVWLFDQSLSLARQREAINERFNTVYEELGVIESSSNPAFAKHEDKPLVTQVVAFGENITPLIENENGTDNLAEIKEAVANMELDESGTEMVFTAVAQAANEYKHLRVPQKDTGEPERNVMIIVVTDERGDDFNNVDTAVKVCRTYEIPVFVIGVPAPFGQEETEVRIDPELGYDQNWGRVSQGPESLMAERVRIGFSAQSEKREPIDSGFGPFALTRLAVETGGIYFTVHPNRNVNREVRKNEIESFSSYMTHFFDPQVMKKYQPDYVSIGEYQKRVTSNQARMVLVKASAMTRLDEMDNPRLRFPKLDEAAFVNSLNEAQKTSAKLTPKAVNLYETLRLGEKDREKEISPRWKAGYDLAMGQVMAVMVRTQAYNYMLAQIKVGKKFEDPKNNTWVLEGDFDMELDSRTEKMQQKAVEYLNRVAEEHPGTPWALIAERELQKPIGWKWTEEYTEPPKPREPGAGNNNNNPRPPRDDAARMLKRNAPKKKLPPL